MPDISALVSPALHESRSVLRDSRCAWNAVPLVTFGQYCMIWFTINFILESDDSLYPFKARNSCWGINSWEHDFSFFLSEFDLQLGNTITVVLSLLLSNFVFIPRSCKSWVHVSCALWIPEVGFGNVSKMEPITRIENIPVSCDCKTFYLQCSEPNKKDLTTLSRTGN